ncbi:MAG: glutathione S-transferase family protein [Xanthomonadales bacterium]|nr:glutathione S-transferase family protein [Xanthomonadales bacterium]NIX13559.1 glutathione S-transferase family protein [Xanthomonadales bacterium]
MLRLFGDRRSGNCYKVVRILELTGRRYEWIETDVLRGETRTDRFLTANPNGKVPLLQLRDGSFLAESNAMLIHLAEGTPYLPEDGIERARVFQWLFFEQYSHEPYIAVARFLLQYDHGQEPDPGRMSMLHERGLQALGVMENVLTRQRFIAGGRFSIADIALYAYTHVAGDSGFELDPFPAVCAWLVRVADRPGHFDLDTMPV